MIGPASSTDQSVNVIRFHADGADQNIKNVARPHGIAMITNAKYQCNSILETGSTQSITIQDQIVKSIGIDAWIPARNQLRETADASAIITINMASRQQPMYHNRRRQTLTVYPFS
jgi:hypothetical protein